MRKYAKFFVTPKGERAARGGHPWVFGEEVLKLKASMPTVIWWMW